MTAEMERMVAAARATTVCKYIEDNGFGKHHINRMAHCYLQKCDLCAEKLVTAIIGAWLETVTPVHEPK
jgi:hypothetical protein